MYVIALAVGPIGLYRDLLHPSTYVVVHRTMHNIIDGLIGSQSSSANPCHPKTGNNKCRNLLVRNWKEHFGVSCVALRPVE